MTVRFIKPTKKTIIITSIVVAIVGLVITGFLIRQLAVRSDATTVVQPEYNTLLPSGTSIEKLGGWERISPPTNDPVYAFTDTISSVAVTVSEQPVPPSFKDDANGKVAELAKAYSATKVIDANGTKVYIGTSAKGPQSTIFIKDSLLILIKSQAKIEDKAWIEYINSLS